MNDSHDLTERVPSEFDEPTGPSIVVPMRALPVAPLAESRAARGTRHRIAVPPPVPIHARRQVAPAPERRPEPDGQLQILPTPRTQSASAEWFAASNTEIARRGEPLTVSHDRSVLRPWNRTVIGAIVVVFVVVGLLAGFAIRRSMHRKPATAKVQTVTLSVTSVPAGASITVIEDGNAVVLGRTPVTASLDPGRTYDLVVALHQHATLLHHIGRGGTSRALSFQLAELK